MVDYNISAASSGFDQFNRRSTNREVDPSSKPRFNKSPLDDKTSSGFGGMGPDPEAKAMGLGSPTNQANKKDDDDDQDIGGVARFLNKFFGAAKESGLEFTKPDRKPKPSIYDTDSMKPIDIDAMDKRIADAVNFDLANPLPSMNFKDDEYAASTYDEVQPLEGADTYKARRITAQGINDTIKGLMDTEQRQADIKQAVNKTIESLKSADANVPYVIQAGDTLSDIAAKTGTTVQDLVKRNNIKDKNKIYTGNQLIIPTDKTVKSKEEVVNNLVENYELRISTRGDEDPQRKFNQSGVPLDQRVYEPEDMSGFGGMGPDPSVGQGIMTPSASVPTIENSLSDDDLGIPDTDNYMGYLPPTPAQAILDKISVGEGATPEGLQRQESLGIGTTPYDMVLAYGSLAAPDKPITQMTLQEVFNFQKELIKASKGKISGTKLGSSAVGKYQLLKSQLFGPKGTPAKPQKNYWADKLNLTPDMIFTPALQEKIGRQALKETGYNNYLKGKKSQKALLDRMSDIWVSIEGSTSGQPIKTSQSELASILDTVQPDYMNLGTR